MSLDRCTRMFALITGILSRPIGINAFVFRPHTRGVDGTYRHRFPSEKSVDCVTAVAPLAWRQPLTPLSASEKATDQVFANRLNRRGVDLSQFASRHVQEDVRHQESQETAFERPRSSSRFSAEESAIGADHTTNVPSKRAGRVQPADSAAVPVDICEDSKQDAELEQWSRDEFRPHDTLEQLQKNVRELEMEVEQLRKESGEEDSDSVLLGTCRFSREGMTQVSVTGSRDLLLFLPGVDGLDIEAREQFNFMSTSFDTWCMTVHGKDKSTFDELTCQVLEFMDILGVTEDRQMVIVGTSFGSLLALDVADQCSERVKGLVLVNPATSLNGSMVHSVGSLVANAPGPEAFGLAAMLTLVATVPDTAKVSRYISEFEALPPQEMPSRFRALVDEWLGLTLSLFDKTSQENLHWRLIKWLGEGSKKVEPLLSTVRLPVLVLAGSEDRLLPSVNEAERLSELIPSCQKIILHGVGHAALHDPGEVDLCKLIKSSVLYDERLLDRVRRSKEAKKAPKRWHKEVEQERTGYESANPASKCTADPILDFKLDMDDTAVELAWKATEAMDRFTSPVFLSINEKGEIERGLGGVPDYKVGRAILFVGNHQLLGIDMPILVRKLVVEKNILVRGLAHPVISGSGDPDFLGRVGRAQANTVDVYGPFRAVRRAARSTVNIVATIAGTMEAGGVTAIRAISGATVTTATAACSFARRITRTNRKAKNQGHQENRNQSEDQSASPTTLGERVSVMMTKLGAVSVTPRNMLKLLKAGESVLLYPGGAKEALHRKGEAYTSFWPERGEFVRMAASCNATIVPFAAVGTADSLEILLDLDEMFSLPFGIGEQMQKTADLMPRARGGDSGEYFVPPLAIPRVPARHYFLFGTPIDTSTLDEQDREKCQAVYDQARLSMRAGIEYLLQARQQDPYGDGAKRLLYETVMRAQGALPTLQRMLGSVDDRKLQSRVNGAEAPSFQIDVASAERFAWPTENKSDGAEPNRER